MKTMPNTSNSHDAGMMRLCHNGCHRPDSGRFHRSVAADVRIFIVIGMAILALVGCVATPQSPQASASDRCHIAEAALRHLLDEHSDSGAERDHFSAYVIERGEFTAELVAALRGHRPPVVADIEVSIESGQAIDKATGKPVKKWSVGIRKLHGDRAIAYVTWYSGNLAAGGHTIHLRRKDGRWIVASEKMEWIS